VVGTPQVIPLVDVKATTRALEPELREAIDRVMRSGQFIGGPEVEAFEAAWARFLGVGFAMGVANGTDAIELMVRAVGLTARDAVLVPANTFIASALGVVRAGVQVKLVDCGEDGLIDCQAARVDSSVRAVMPVHLFGQCADLDTVQGFANSHGLSVLEDAAQAHGATWRDRSAGTFGVAAATSFYPGKNLGALGDAGAVMTADPALAQRVRALRNYGSEVKYTHPVLGFNSRLDALQAAVLSVKLKHLAEWNHARAQAAERYDVLLRDWPQVRPLVRSPGQRHVFHLYVIRVPAEVRDRVVASMQHAGIGVGLHYPVPIHLQGAFATLGHHAGDFPVAERLAREMISLPMYPELTADQQGQVIAALGRAMEQA
jgi:dTDP-4-amino-4,6-dideoxygalactose transaminase